MDKSTKDSIECLVYYLTNGWRDYDGDYQLDTNDRIITDMGMFVASVNAYAVERERVLIDAMLERLAGEEITMTSRQVIDFIKAYKP